MCESRASFAASGPRLLIVDITPRTTSRAVRREGLFRARSLGLSLLCVFILRESGRGGFFFIEQEHMICLFFVFILRESGQSKIIRFVSLRESGRGGIFKARA